MPGLTLLNIDREKTPMYDPLSEIREIITDIENFIATLENPVQAARLVPLKMKLRALLGAVGQFGTDGTIPVNTKQAHIMELHPDLQLLANRLSQYGDKFSVQVEICMNFLLNHLCSTAASDPKSTVIGVSNVMAQVLSSETTISKPPDFDISTNDPKYFEEFARIYNSMLTTAGLFAAPVLGLPDIPISALGGWADQALEQFGVINRFVKEHYNPKVFYLIDKAENARPFDTTTDILSFYVYENEFLSALISRADILSGLDFPAGLGDNTESVQLTSTEDITTLLAETIENNCNQIDNVMTQINDLFTSGMINRNEKPDDYPDLMFFTLEAKMWRSIARLAKLMIQVFLVSNDDSIQYEDFNLHISSGIEIPPPDDHPPSDVNIELHETLDDMFTTLFEMFPEAKLDVETFIRSSDFTKFRDYLQYFIHIVAAHDILLKSTRAWTPWLLDHLKPYLLGSASQYNPHGSLELGTLSTILGIITKTDFLVEEGHQILLDVKPHLEFQIHHVLAIEVLTNLINEREDSGDNIARSTTEVVMKFINKYQLNPQSMLFQKANLYLAMLVMYQEQGEFLRKENERFVAFDPFSWIQVPKSKASVFPYMPLNTSVDNLNSN